MAKQGRKMKAMASLASGDAVLVVGCVVNIKVEDVDRSRIDPTGIVAVVVEVSSKGLYR
jgi:hypothetical protein